MNRPWHASVLLALASSSGGAILSSVIGGRGFHALLGWSLYGVGAAIFLSSAILYVFIQTTRDREQAEAEDLAGDWEVESTTLTSGKTASGLITFEVSEGRISGKGTVSGEKGHLIAFVTSQACYYHEQLLTMVYMYSSQDDNGAQADRECILKGIVRELGREIEGRWRQLDWDGDGRVGGDMRLVKKDASRPNQARN